MNMAHPTVLSVPQIRANMTRCRKGIERETERLNGLMLLTAGKDQIPEWLCQRIKEAGNGIWSYQRQLDEYEGFLRERGLRT